MAVSHLKEMDEEEIEERVQALREFQLEPVTERVRYKKGYENADELERKFRRFAKMLLESPEKNLAPAEDLDEYWHTFILDTVRYEKFCDEVFGGFLHHTPGEPGERDVEAYIDRVKNDEVHESDAFCHARIEGDDD